MLGLNKDVVALTQYRQEWKELFTQEKVFVDKVLRLADM